MAEEKYFTQRFMERFGLEFPKDAKKFAEIIEKNFSENGTLGQLFDDVAKAFPKKRRAY